MLPVSAMLFTTPPTIRSSSGPLHLTKWLNVCFVFLSLPTSNFLTALSPFFVDFAALRVVHAHIVNMSFLCPATAAQVRVLLATVCYAHRAPRTIR